MRQEPAHAVFSTVPANCPVQDYDTTTSHHSAGRTCMQTGKDKQYSQQQPLSVACAAAPSHARAAWSSWLPAGAPQAAVPRCVHGALTGLPPHRCRSDPLPRGPRS